MPRVFQSGFVLLLMTAATGQPAQSPVPSLKPEDGVSTSCSTAPAATAHPTTRRPFKEPSMRQAAKAGWYLSRPGGGFAGATSN